MNKQERAWVAAYRRILEYTGWDDFAVRMARHLVGSDGWEDWSDSQLDVWIDAHEDTPDGWRNHATALKRARAGLPYQGGIVGFDADDGTGDSSERG